MNWLANLEKPNLCRPIQKQCFRLANKLFVSLQVIGCKYIRSMIPSPIEFNGDLIICGID